MKPTFIGITGGTGSGKSTLAMSLLDKNPHTIGIVQLDDYFKPDGEKPRFHGIVNCDHPDALYMDQFVQDLRELAEGRSVVINTKNERLNPHYRETKKRIPVRFDPKPIMLIEGFLVLFDERVRNMLTTSIWLDIAHDKRWERRVHFKNPEYQKKVLIPMEAAYLDPSKKFADHVIDVSEATLTDLVSRVEKIIFKNRKKV